jgi:hypothetical protein
LGIDNTYDLLFWNKIEEYSSKINKIYTPDREISDEDKIKLFNSDIKYDNNSEYIYFYKKSSWSKDFIENGPEILKRISIPKICLLPAPGPVSSTTLRTALKEENYELIQNLIGKKLFDTNLWKQYNTLIN